LAGELRVERGDDCQLLGHRDGSATSSLRAAAAYDDIDPAPGGRVIGEGTFHRWWGRCIETAGVRYPNPHVTRHTFATNWLRRGGRLETLSQTMGHASIRTTFDLYAHLDTRDAEADMAIVFGEISPGGPREIAAKGGIKAPTRIELVYEALQASA
jgi:hypothetical protein